MNTSPSTRELRQFAGIWLVALLAMAGSMAWRGSPPAWHYSVAAAAVLVPAAGLIWLPLLRVVFVAMQVAAFPIGWVVSRLLLIVVFFLVFVPTGMLLRLSGRDPLTRRFESTRSTYWLPRTPMRHPRDYFRQF